MRGSVRTAWNAAGRRWLVLACALALSGGACGPGDGAEPGGAPASSSSSPAISPLTTVGTDATTTTAPATTVAGAPTTTTVPAPPPVSTVTTVSAVLRELPPVLVAGAAGLQLEAAGGPASLLVNGPVAYAVADTRGGVLFQVDRGRAWSEDPTGVASTVWWVPAGRSAARDLLVTSPQSRLSLHDAVPVGDDVLVLYTRSDGSSIFDAVDRLRSYSLSDREVREIMIHGAWEEGYSNVRAAGGLISLTEFGQVDSACRTMDHGGAPAFLRGVPQAAGCEDMECPWACTLAGDGKRFAFVQRRLDPATGAELGYEVVLRTTSDGAEAWRFPLELDGGYPFEIDIAGDAVLVNRVRPDRRPLPVLVAVPGEDGSVRSHTLPVGVGRFVVGEVRIPRTVASPVPRPAIASFTLLPDGLGSVEFGAPAEPAVAVLISLLGEPTSDILLRPPWETDGPGTCFSATGYACTDYFRFMTWAGPGLSVVLTDGPLYGVPGVPHLSGWLAGEPEVGPGPVTERSIGVGASVADLVAAYGDGVRLPGEPDDCTGGWHFVLIGADSPPLRGTLTGSPDDPGAAVAGMEAGQGSSC